MKTDREPLIFEIRTIQAAPCIEENGPVNVSWGLWAGLLAHAAFAIFIHVFCHLNY